MNNVLTIYLKINEIRLRLGFSCCFFMYLWKIIRHCPSYKISKRIKSFWCCYVATF